MENRTSGIIQETRKHIRKKPGISATQNQGIKQPHVQAQVQPSVQNDQELQLKASRDVRWQLYVTGLYCMFGLPSLVIILPLVVFFVFGVTL